MGLSSIIKVAICHSHGLLVESLVKVLQKDEGFYVTKVSSSMTELKNFLSSSYNYQHPDVIVVDSLVADGVTLPSILSLKKYYPRIKVFVLCSQGNSPVEVVKMYGADGYGGKNISHAQLRGAIRDTVKEKGEFWHQSLPQEDVQILYLKLSPMEMRVLSLISFSNKEVATRLNLSNGTVRNYISSIYKKLQTKDRRWIAEYSKKHGFVIDG